MNRFATSLTRLRSRLMHHARCINLPLRFNSLRVKIGIQNRKSHQMRTKLITILALAFTLLTAKHSSANTIVRADAATIRNWCEGEAYRNFSPRLLSSTRTQISMNVQISDQGYPTYKVIDASAASAADRFYCEQAIWEAAPIRPQWAPEFSGAKFSLVFPQTDPRRLGHNYFDNLVSEKDEVSKEQKQLVCMHLIPASIVAKASEKSPQKIDVDASANIVKILASKSNSRLLSRFRKEWFNYALHNSDITLDSVNEKSQQLRIKYSKLFSDK